MDPNRARRITSQVKFRCSRLEPIVAKDTLSREDILEIANVMELKSNLEAEIFEILGSDPEDRPANLSDDSLYQLLDRFTTLTISSEAKLEPTRNAHSPSELSPTTSLDDLDEAVPPVGILSEHSSHSSRSSLVAAPKSVPVPHHKLPRIELPAFDPKNFNEWINFKALFSSLVIGNAQLSNVERLHYLRTTVKGDALSIIQSLSLEDKNFEIAWSTLVNQYDRPRAIATSHWTRLLDHPPVQADTSALESFLTTIKTSVNALKALELPVESWDFVLTSVILHKVDAKTRELFESTNTKVYPSFDELIAFLENRTRSLQTAELYGSPTSSRPQKLVHKPHTSKSRQVFLTETAKKCVACKNSHTLQQCSQFLKMTPRDRFSFAKKNSLCLNCLSKAHRLSSCSSQFNCRSCGSRHHSLLHFQSSIEQKPESTVSTEEKDRESRGGPPLSSMFASNTSSVVLLSTIVVSVHFRGKRYKVRALLDSGSQASFVLDSFASELGLQRLPSKLHIKGISNKSVTNVLNSVKLHISSADDTKPTMVCHCHCLESISGPLPSTAPSIKMWPHVNNLKLADPTFAEPRSVSLLIGADCFPQIVLDGRRTGPPGTPMAIETVFGWALVGPAQCSSFLSLVDSMPDSPSNTELHSLHVTLDEVAASLWQLDQIPESSSISAEDIYCESLFSKETERLNSGRYCAPLLFKSGEPVLGNSENVAKKRFLSLEHRLENNSSLKNEYHKAIQAYIDDGHLQKIQYDSTVVPGYFMPHHGVVKLDSNTTKLRVVFDAASKTENGRSLNDTLYPGPKLQKEISEVLLRFRLEPIVLTGDVKKMFCQVKVLPKHHPFQRIIWRFSPKDPLEFYELTSLVFGITCSPFLAIRSLHKLVSDEGHRFRLASNALLNNLYVDDLLVSCRDVETARSLIQELSNLLELGGFEMRKWCSNHPAVLNGIDAEDQALQSDVCFDADTFLKVLGMFWSPQSDCFSYKTALNDSPSTKRGVLSTLAKIFDPLGLLAPCILQAKLFLKELWQQNLDWDDQLPAFLINRWHSIKEDFVNLSKLSIPRFYFHSDLSCRYHLHCFADASQDAYAGVVFVVVVDSEGTNSYIVAAKTRVSPTKKQISLPRLELLACVLASKLLVFVLDTYRNSIEFESIHCWSDSTIALHWIQSTPSRWQTFVANRVSLIQELTKVEWWNHIRSFQNPADCASRGLGPSALIKFELWWKGPSFITLPQDCWPHLSPPSAKFDEKELEVRRKSAVALLLVNEFKNPVKPTSLSLLLDRTSTLVRLQRVTAFIFRACTPSVRRPRGPLSVDELDRALNYWIKIIQAEHFAKDLDKVKKGLRLSRELARLAPYLDERGIFRVGGRLDFSELNNDTRHPVLLPKKCHFSVLVVRFYHVLFGHLGTSALLATVRTRYWILSGRQVTRSVVFQCTTCYTLRPRFAQPQMGSLPPHRVRKAQPFSKVSVDLAGPFAVKSSKLKRSPITKGYIVCFVCTVIKAAHLEFVSDLSSQSFLAALDRFIARRGLPSDIFSDNGTNFVGADKEIRRLVATIMTSDSIVDSLSSRKVRWHFQPPSAPHFGGLHEALVKSVKTHLARVIGAGVLTFEEFTTVLTKIEACLNSRPLVAISDDPNDCDVLTPAHFLVMRPLTMLPEDSLEGTNSGLLKRWQLVRQIHQRFWRLWQEQYLTSLQQRPKWQHSEPNIKIGSLVVLRDNDCSPMSWKIGRIVELYPGKDGIARVASVYVPYHQNGVIIRKIFKRPCVKLAPLPYQSAESAS